MKNKTKEWLETAEGRLRRTLASARLRSPSPARTISRRLLFFLYFFPSFRPPSRTRRRADIVLATSASAKTETARRSRRPWTIPTPPSPAFRPTRPPNSATPPRSTRSTPTGARARALPSGSSRPRRAGRGANTPSPETREDTRATRKTSPSPPPRMVCGGTPPRQAPWASPKAPPRARRGGW